jgi:UDP-N-acetylmuramoyl-L-alanyl-D-glutamate--2,6-diaminopimelate ligase
VFGATGGGRDKWKRPEFGAIAQRYCDEIILTDDDPYEEDRKQILDEIEVGITNAVYVRQILDRKEAIATAIKSAKPGDTVVITGKGSEPVMAIAGGKKIPWSDRDIAREFLS